MLHDVPRKIFPHGQNQRPEGKNFELPAKRDETNNMINFILVHLYIVYGFIYHVDVACRYEMTTADYLL